jgi:hypothetical protein
MSQLLNPPRPVIYPTTGFHTHQARRQIGEKRSHLVAPELFPQHCFALLINPMYLDNVLCQIQPN